MSLFEVLGSSIWMTVLLGWTVWITIIIILAVLGISAGVRRHFVDILLVIFQFCRENLVEKEKCRFHVTAEHEQMCTEEPVIAKDIVMTQNHGVHLHLDGRQLNGVDLMHRFHLQDSTWFAKGGIEAIVQDDVTSRFEAEEIAYWNLLTRTNVMPEFISWKISVVWFLGCVLRYLILFPFRLSLFFVALIMVVGGNFFIGFIPWRGLRKWTYRHLNMASNRVLMRSFSLVANFHNRQYRAKGGGICVANHTSPIDTFLLGTDNVYAMVGQLQPGLFGLVQWALNEAESHVWFNRAEAADRLAVSRRLRQHVMDSNKLPILIFPEGTCINNTSIMMFKKGSFETGGVIYPVAIKYDSRFSDAFWNSSKYALPIYLLMLITSWALVADVWYLPPQTLQEGETAVEFANRVKSDIARKGGLVDLDWDGQLKRYRPKDTLKAEAQKSYSETLETEENGAHKRA